MSSVTRIWPSQAGEAPMPMVGTGTISVSSRRQRPRRRPRRPAKRRRPRRSRRRRAMILSRSRLVMAARAVAAERIDRLRRQPDMAHHRHAAPGQERDRLGHLLAAFELDRHAAGLGHHPGGGAERLLRRGLIAAERQVDDDQRVLGRPHHRGAMRDHHVERDRQGAVEAVDHHRQAVADQEEIDLGSSSRATGAV